MRRRSKRRCSDEFVCVAGTVGVVRSIGTLLTTLVGIVVWNDPFSIIVGIGMIAVVAGIALLSKGTQEAEEAVAEATATEATAQS